MKAESVREGLLEKASLGHWRRGQGSREDEGHMLVAAWHMEKDLCSQLSLTTCVILVKSLGLSFPNAKCGSWTRWALTALM